MKKIVLLISFFVLFTVIPFAHADCNDPSCAAAAGNPKSLLININQLLDDTLHGTLKFKFDSSVTLSTILSRLLFIVYGIAGMGILLYLIYGGFHYLTSAGDPKKAETAKTILTHAVIGFFLVVVAFWITQIVSFIFNLGSAFPG